MAFRWLFRNGSLSFFDSRRWAFRGLSEGFFDSCFAMAFRVSFFGSDGFSRGPCDGFVSQWLSIAFSGLFDGLLQWLFADGFSMAFVIAFLSRWLSVAFDGVFRWLCDSAVAMACGGFRWICR